MADEVTYEVAQDATINNKYKKLAEEYSKLKAHNQVLKRALIETRSEKDALNSSLKSKEQQLRKLTQEQESLQFVNNQLKKRVEVLQSSLNEPHKSGQKKRSGSHVSSSPASTNAPLEDKLAILETELTAKIHENEELHFTIETLQSEHRKVISELTDKLKSYQSKHTLQLTQDATENLERKIVIESLKKENEELLKKLQQQTNCDEENKHECCVGSQTSIDDNNGWDKHRPNGGSFTFTDYNSLDTCSIASSKSVCDAITSSTIGPVMTTSNSSKPVKDPKDIYVSMGVFADQFLSCLSTWHTYEADRLTAEGGSQPTQFFDLANTHNTLSLTLKESVNNFRHFTLSLSCQEKTNESSGEHAADSSSHPHQPSENNVISKSSNSCSSHENGDGLAAFGLFLVPFLLYLNGAFKAFNETSQYYENCSKTTLPIENRSHNNECTESAELSRRLKQLSVHYNNLSKYFQQLHSVLSTFDAAFLSFNNNSNSNAPSSNHNYSNMFDSEGKYSQSDAIPTPLHGSDGGTASNVSKASASSFIYQLKHTLTCLRTELKATAKSVNNKIGVEHQLEDVDEKVKTANECVFSSIHSLSRCTSKLSDIISENESFFILSINQSQKRSLLTDKQQLSTTNNTNHSHISRNKKDNSSNSIMYNKKILQANSASTSVGSLPSAAVNNITHETDKYLPFDENLRFLTIEQIKKQLFMNQCHYNQLVDRLSEIDAEVGSRSVRETTDNVPSIGDVSHHMTEDVPEAVDLRNLSISGQFDLDFENRNAAFGGCNCNAGFALLYKDEADVLYKRLCLSESMACQVSKERSSLRERLVLMNQELESTRESYQQQLSAMSEHVCELNEQLNIYRELQHASSVAAANAHSSYSSSSNGGASGISSNKLSLNKLNLLSLNRGGSTVAAVASERGDVTSNFITPSQVQFQPPHSSRTSHNSGGSSSKSKFNIPNVRASSSTNDLSQDDALCRSGSNPNSGTNNTASGGSNNNNSGIHRNHSNNSFHATSSNSSSSNTLTSIGSNTLKSAGANIRNIFK